MINEISGNPTFQMLDDDSFCFCLTSYECEPSIQSFNNDALDSWGNAHISLSYSINDGPVKTIRYGSTGTDSNPTPLSLFRGVMEFNNYVPDESTAPPVNELMFAFDNAFNINEEARTITGIKTGDLMTPTTIHFYRTTEDVGRYDVFDTLFGSSVESIEIHSCGLKVIQDECDGAINTCTVGTVTGGGILDYYINDQLIEFPNGLGREIFANALLEQYGIQTIPLDADMNPTPIPPYYDDMVFCKYQNISDKTLRVKIVTADASHVNNYIDLTNPTVIATENEVTFCLAPEDMTHIATVIYQQNSTKSVKIMLNAAGETWAVGENGKDLGFIPSKIPDYWGLQNSPNNHYIFQFIEDYDGWVFDIEGQINGRQEIAYPNDLQVRPIGLVSHIQQVEFIEDGDDPWPYTVTRPALYNPYNSLERIVLPYLPARGLVLRFSGHQGYGPGMVDKYTVGYDDHGVFMINSNGFFLEEYRDICEQIGSIKVDGVVFNWEWRDVGWTSSGAWGFWGVPASGFTPETINLLIEYIRPDSGEIVRFNYPYTYTL